MEEIEKKRLQHLIDIRFLMGAHFREERKIVFGKLYNLWALLFTLHVLGVFSFLIIVYKLYG